MIHAHDERQDWGTACSSWELGDNFAETRQEVNCPRCQALDIWTDERADVLGRFTDELAKATGDGSPNRHLPTLPCQKCGRDVTNKARASSTTDNGSTWDGPRCYPSCPETGFTTKASAEETKFSSGMKRDSNKGKPRFDLCFPEGVPYSEQMLTRFAALMARGAELRGDRNWENADSETDLSRFRESAFRHFFQWYCGETDEDHLAGFLFNAQGAEFVKRKLGAS